MVLVDRPCATGVWIPFSGSPSTWCARALFCSKNDVRLERETSLLTTDRSGSTDVFGVPASRHGSLNPLFQVAVYLPSWSSSSQKQATSQRRWNSANACEAFTCKPRPESGLDCLQGIFARHGQHYPGFMDAPVTTKRTQERRRGASACIYAGAPRGCDSGTRETTFIAD